MSELAIDLNWHREAPEMKPGKYNTGHEISYGNVHQVKADAAPDWGGDPKATNPEQAMAAALSSCHMMTFLALCAKAKWPVSTYKDHASAELGKNDNGQMSVSQIKLKPKISFDHGFEISPKELLDMHERAHRYCFVANSISAKMVIRPVL